MEHPRSSHSQTVPALSVRAEVAEHTPGPWYVGSRDKEFCLAVHSEAPGLSGYRAADVCRVWHTRENAALRSIGEANARLIAAAPELLAALEDLMAMRSECFIPNDGDWWDKKARAAIRRATKATETTAQPATTAEGTTETAAAVSSRSQP